MINHNYTQKLLSKRFKNISQNDYIHLFRYVFSAVTNLDKKNLGKRILLQGFFKLHRQELRLSNVSHEFQTSLKDKHRLRKSLRGSKIVGQRDEVETLMEFLFKKSTEANPSSVDLYITQAIYQFYIFNNTWGALQSLGKAKRVGTVSLPQNYAIQRIHFDIKQRIHRNNEKEKSNIDSFVRYESQYRDLLKLVKKSCDETDQFWKSLVKDYPDPKFLVNKGMNVAKMDKDVKKIYLEIENERVSTKISCLYADYLENVMNDSEMSRRVFKESWNFLTNCLKIDIVDENLEKNHFSEALLIVSVTDNFELGEITQSFGEANKVLNETNEELIGKRVTDLLPKFFREDHEVLVKDFFSSKRTEPNIKNRSVWVLDKDGYTNKIKLIITPRKEINRSLEFCVIVRAIEESFLSKTLGIFEILFKQSTGQIVGFSRNCDAKLGISSSIINKQQQQKLFIQDIVDKELDEILTNGEKVVHLVLDTTKLEQKFLITKHDLDIDLDSADLDGGSASGERDDLFIDEMISERKRMAFQKKFKVEEISAVVSKTIMDTPGSMIMALKFVKSSALEESQRSTRKSENLTETEDLGKREIKKLKLKSEHLAEIMETERLVQEEIEKQREEKTPFQATLLRHTIIWILVIFVILFLFEFFMKGYYKENLKQAVDYQIAMEKRGLLISRTGYLSYKAFLYQT